MVYQHLVCNMKKYLYILSLITLITLSSLINNALFFNVSQEEGIPTNNLEIYYELDGDAQDESGNARHANSFGVYFGDSLDINGETNKCGYFDGTNDRMTYPGGVIDMETDFSVSLWLSMNDLVDNQRFFNLSDSSTTVPRFNPTVDDDDSLRINTRNDATTTFTTTGIKIVTYTWYHVVVVRDADGGTQTLYVDNVEIASSAMTGNYTNNDNVTLGALMYNNSPIQFAHCKIDKVRIYSDELTVSEIAALYGERQ